MMNARRIVVGAVVLATMLALTAGWAQARAPSEQSRADPQPRPALDLVAGSIPIQGRLTDASGAPLTGLHDFTYSIYDSDSGGTLLCQRTSSDVSVANGLFNDTISNCPASIFDGQALWLGIAVLPDAEMTPRQPIQPVPYALSLRPGGVVSNTVASTHGLTLKSNATGGSGSALWAEDTNVTGGIAVWAVARGADASVVIENTSTGPLLKGFGGDGGEDEFRLGNDGSIQSKADTYLFVPGVAFVPDFSSSGIEWALSIDGGVMLQRGTGGSSQSVFLPITLPAVLYGQPVEIESMTVYYYCDNGANNYIDHTWLVRQVTALSNQVLVNDDTNLTSGPPTSYTFYPGAGNVLSSDSGIVFARFVVHFEEGVNYVTIGGIRLRLHHHSLGDD